MTRQADGPVDVITNTGPGAGVLLCKCLGVSFEEAVRRTGEMCAVSPPAVRMALVADGFLREKGTFYSVMLDLCREKRGKKA